MKFESRIIVGLLSISIDLEHPLGSSQSKYGFTRVQARI